MKYCKHCLYVWSAVILLGFWYGFPPSVMAQNCAVSVSDSTYTIVTEACGFSEAVDGVDAGSGGLNSAKLVVPSGTYVTLRDGASNPSTLIVGSLKMDGGTVNMPTGAQIIIGQGTCVTDTDGDGYVDSGTQSFVPFGTTPAADCIRKGTYQGGAHPAIVDCAPNDPARNVSCLVSSDLGSGSFNRITNTSDPTVPALQDYYQEIGKDNSLVGLWHLNETSGNAVDFSGNGNTGVPNGTTIVDGRIEKARNFNGSTDYVNVADSNSLDLTTTGTVEAWIKISAIPSAISNIVHKGTFTGLNAGAYGISLDTNGKARAYIHNSTSYSMAVSGNAVGLNQWNHIAGTWDGTIVRIYINGILEGSVSQVYTPAASTTALRIGSVTEGGYCLAGSIDEVAVFNRALAPEEIKLQASRRPWASYTSSVLDLGGASATTTLSWTWAGVGTRTYSSGTITSDGGETPYSNVGLVGQWNFNSTSGTTATNDAGASSCGGTASNCNGTLTSFASTDSQDQAAGTGWTNANKRWGVGGLMFDGTDDHVIVPDRDALDITGAITVAAWVKPTGYQYTDIIHKLDTSSGYGGGGYEFSVDINGIVKFYKANGIAGGGACTGSNWDCVNSTTKLPLNQWSYIMGVWTGSTGANQMKIYINGVLDAEAAASQSTIKANTYDFWIGKSKSNPDVKFKGVMDNVSIYSRALDASEVLSNYNAGAIELQWRAGSTTAPDSTDYGAGTNWTQWAPVGTAGYESQLDAMDSTQASWYWDIASAGNADGTTATNMPKAKAQETTLKQEGTGSLKLSIGQLQTDANTVGLWHLDETGGTGAYVKDSSANANNGTPTGTTVIDGFFNKARSFTGTTDKILSSSNISITGANVRTLEFWLFPTRTTGECYLGYGAGTTANFFEVGSYYNNNWSFHCYACSWDTGIKIAPYLNKWSHHVITYDGTNVRWYINGSLIGTSGSIALNTSAGPLYFGRAAHDTSYPFNGYMDEVKLSNIVKTADQIAEAYRAGRGHTLTGGISSTDATSKTKLPFWIASDRLGTFSEMTVGESQFANYEPDANTKGLWHLEEQSGSGAFFGDQTGGDGNYASISFGAPAFAQGKIGKGRYFNGSSLTIPVTAGTPLDIVGSPVTLSAWIYPTALPASSGYVLARNYSYGLFFASTSKVGCGGVNLSNFVSTNTIPLNTWTHVSCIINGASSKLYINGALDSTGTLTAQSSNANNIYFGSFTGQNYYFSGTIDEPRIDNVERTAAQIRQAYEVGLRSHPITIDFRANLAADALIADINDVSFSVDETAYGSSAKANHLFVGDKIIVKENYDGTEYVAQGTVATVNSSTGAVTVSSWDTGSAVPSGGFTVNAIVFKWQRELMDLTGIPIGTGTGDAIDAKDALTRLTLRLTDTSQGATMWLDDLRAGGPYFNTSSQAITISPAKQYLQIRALFTSSDVATSSSFMTLSTDNVKPTLTPTPTP